MNEDRQHPRTVSLEDLLRLKRAEQPSLEFWAHFEGELRVKQLAAMVGKRPWWCAFPRVSLFVSRQRLALGGAAAAAVAVGVGIYGFRTGEFRIPAGVSIAQAPARVAQAP